LGRAEVSISKTRQDMPPRWNRQSEEAMPKPEKPPKTTGKTHKKRWRTFVRHRVEIVLGLKEATSS